MFSKARWCVVHIWVLWLNIKHVNHRSYFHPLCTRREEVGNFFFLFHKKSEFWSCLILQLTRNAQILLQHLLVPLGRETRHGNSSCNKPGCYLDNKKYWKLLHKYLKKNHTTFGSASAHCWYTEEFSPLLHLKPTLIRLRDIGLYLLHYFIASICFSVWCMWVFNEI